jgi:hypothetical protein
MVMGIDTSLLVAAAASFIAGLLGYIIARLWILPILRYAMTRRKLDRELKRYQTLVRQHALPETSARRKPKAWDDIALSARRHAMKLVSGYTKEIPYWYRLLLDSRQESPSEALALLTNISKVNAEEQITNRIQKARHAMRLK